MIVCLPTHFLQTNVIHVRSQWVFMRSEAGIFCKRSSAIEGHTCSRTDIWLPTDSLWFNPKIYFQTCCHIHWLDWLFAWLTKVATELVLIVTHHWFCSRSKRQAIYLTNLKRVLTTLFIPVSLDKSFRVGLFVSIFVAGINPKSFDFRHFQTNSQSYLLNSVYQFHE